jgi:hypothetical protein
VYLLCTVRTTCSFRDIERDCDAFNEKRIALYTIPFVDLSAADSDSDKTKSASCTK